MWSAVRLWTLHPRYLDDSTLREAWRDGLTARRRLAAGPDLNTSDPVLLELAATRKPLATVDRYLRSLFEEARRRGKAFDLSRLGTATDAQSIPISSERVRQDWAELMGVIERRDPDRHARLKNLQRPHCHPAFRRHQGKSRPPGA